MNKYRIVLSETNQYIVFGEDIFIDREANISIVNYYDNNGDNIKVAVVPMSATIICEEINVKGLS